MNFVARSAVVSMLAAAVWMPPVRAGAAPASPSAEQLRVARDYVVSARFVEMLDGMVNYMAAHPNGGDSADDLAMKRRIVRDLSREVIADSLARSLAADTPAEVLKAGLAHANSDIGRVEFGCLSRWPPPAEGYQACLEAGASKTQIVRMAAHGESESGWPLVDKLLKGDAIVTALNAATSELAGRDPEIAAQLADYCKREPGEGMCGYRKQAAAAMDADAAAAPAQGTPNHD